MVGESKSLSIIIPLAEGESAHASLLAELISLKQVEEIILVKTLNDSQAFDFENIPQVKIVRSTKGRAQQLNAGATFANKGNFLWFIHADCTFGETNIKGLLKPIDQKENALYYFDLRFKKDGPQFMEVNSWGAQVRSKYLGLPFGDQAFGISEDNFSSLGGFNETCDYGEDHLFVWQARRNGMKVKSVGCQIYTSARRYREQGWGTTTLKHLFLTAKQGLPQFLSYMSR